MHRHGAMSFRNGSLLSKSAALWPTSCEWLISGEARQKKDACDCEFKQLVQFPQPTHAMDAKVAVL